MNIYISKSKLVENRHLHGLVDYLVDFNEVKNVSFFDPKKSKYTLAKHVNKEVDLIILLLNMKETTINYTSGFIGKGGYKEMEEATELEIPILVMFEDTFEFFEIEDTILGAINYNDWAHYAELEVNNITSTRINVQLNKLNLKKAANIDTFNPLGPKEITQKEKESERIEEAGQGIEIHQTTNVDLILRRHW